MSKAILLDPEYLVSNFSHTTSHYKPQIPNLLKEVEVNDYTDINKHLDVSIFTAVRVDDATTCYIDDEGLINDTQYGVEYHFYSQPLFGRALFVGLNPDGSDCDVKLSRSDVAQLVRNIVLKTPNFSKNDD